MYTLLDIKSKHYQWNVVKVSIQKVRTGKQGKNFQKKEENENFPINFYLQVLVLVLTEMQMQLYKY